MSLGRTCYAAPPMPTRGRVAERIQLVSLLPPGEGGPQGRMRVRDGSMALPNSWWRLLGAEPSPQPLPWGLPLVVSRRERGFWLLSFDANRVRLFSKRYRNRCLCWPRNRLGFAPGDAGSMATADHEATGGSDAVRMSADAENVTAIGQSTRTASCIQAPIGRREGCVVALTQSPKHRSCHHL